MINSTSFAWGFFSSFHLDGIKLISQLVYTLTLSGIQVFVSWLRPSCYVFRTCLKTPKILTPPILLPPPAIQFNSIQRLHIQSRDPNNPLNNQPQEEG